jgi:integral membrane protein
MLSTALGRLRFIGTFEAISFLVLLLIAMPLKYAADIPEPVTIVGIVHGALFSLYLLAILNAVIVRKISIGMTLLAILAAFLPFGPFYVDRKLR